MLRTVYTATPVGLISAFRDEFSQIGRLGFTSDGAYLFVRDVVSVALRVVNTPFRAALLYRTSF